MSRCDTDAAVLTSPSVACPKVIRCSLPTAEISTFALSASAALRDVGLTYLAPGKTEKLQQEQERGHHEGRREVCWGAVTSGERQQLGRHWLESIENMNISSATCVWEYERKFSGFSGLGFLLTFFCLICCSSFLRKQQLYKLPMIAVFTSTLLDLCMVQPPKSSVMLNPKHTVVRFLKR